jgi:hypothetical protein
MARALALWLAGLVAGCGPTAAHKVITAADVVDPVRTTISTSLKAPLREGTTTEETPSSIRPDAVADEAQIRRLTATEVCFNLLVRTPISMDAPLASWRATVNERPVQLGGDVITVRDHPCTGEPPRTVVAGIAQEAFAALRIGEPKDIAFRVVERRMKRCFPRGGAGKRVKLGLTLPGADGKGDWGLAFDWHIEGG